MIYKAGDPYWYSAAVELYRKKTFPIQLGSVTQEDIERAIHTWEENTGISFDILIKRYNGKLGGFQIPDDLAEDIIAKKGNRERWIKEPEKEEPGIWKWLAQDQKTERKKPKRPSESDHQSVVDMIEQISQKGTSIYQIAKKLDVAYTTVQCWSKGKTYPSQKNREKLEVLFDSIKQTPKEENNETVS